MAEVNTKTESKPDAEEDTRTLKEKILGEVKFFAGLIVFLLFFWTTIFGHYKIPSESMQPTLEVGDHLYVSKFAYGYSRHSLPFNLHKLPFLPKEGKVWSRLPKRGDVVVFRNPYTGIVMIKRAFGLPGDQINVIGGRYYINNELVERDQIERIKYRAHRDDLPTSVNVYHEQFPGEKESHTIYEMSDRRPRDNAGERTVPDGMVFFLGDNRDNSIDSRAAFGHNNPNTGPGFVPIDMLIGRADLIMFSFKTCKKEEGFHCPKRRFLSPI